jgi:hypothetical protein
MFFEFVGINLQMQNLFLPSLVLNLQNVSAEHGLVCLSLRWSASTLVSTHIATIRESRGLVLCVLNTRLQIAIEAMLNKR